MRGAPRGRGGRGGPAGLWEVFSRWLEIRPGPARPPVREIKSVHYSAAVSDFFAGFAAAFFFGFADFAGFLAVSGAGLATRESLRGPLRRGAGLAPVFSARASISSIASASVISSGFLASGIVALMPLLAT